VIQGEKNKFGLKLREVKKNFFQRKTEARRAEMVPVTRGPAWPSSDNGPKSGNNAAWRHRAAWDFSLRHLLRHLQAFLCSSSGTVAPIKLNTKLVKWKTS